MSFSTSSCATVTTRFCVELGNDVEGGMKTIGQMGAGILYKIAGCVVVCVHVNACSMVMQPSFCVSLCRIFDFHEYSVSIF